MKRYLVEFASTSAEVEAEDEEGAVELAKELYYNGELLCEVTGVKKLEETCEHIWNLMVEGDWVCTGCGIAKSEVKELEGTG